MDKQALLTLIKTEISNIAPEVEWDDIDFDEDLRDELDLDSMDFMNLVTGLGKKLGLEIPEVDYQKMYVLDQMVDYLLAGLAKETV